VDKWLGRLSCRIGRHHWEILDATFSLRIYGCSRCHETKATNL